MQGGLTSGDIIMIILEAVVRTSLVMRKRKKEGIKAEIGSINREEG
jgi:hypothetical protein